MWGPRCGAPGQCSALGGRSVYAGFVAIGSCVCKTSAKTAVSAITSMRTPPAAPSGFFRRNRAVTGHTPGRARASATTAISAGLTAIPHPRERATRATSRNEHHEARGRSRPERTRLYVRIGDDRERREATFIDVANRSEEHTSELQSPCNLVCRLLLEKKK